MPQEPPQTPRNGSNWPYWGNYIVFAFVLAFVLIANVFIQPKESETTLSYSALKEIVRTGEVQSAELREHDIIVETRAAGSDDTQALRAVVPPDVALVITVGMTSILAPLFLQ